MSEKIVNINVGILGHVDSGKTSLARALSTELSTASLDKHPQSSERGITLDLGFSAFTVNLREMCPELAESLSCDKLQFTLVDCPGHASLIRTIIGGAQIIDFMMLVVDVTKGIQTQTAECLVVGEILSEHLLVVLNKTDLLPEATREDKIEKMKKRLQLTFKGTKFAGCKMSAVAVRPGGADTMQQGVGAPPHGVKELVQDLLGLVPRQPRKVDGSFLFAVDHCFPIKGQGTVMTGTVLQGSVSVNQTVEIASLKVEKKVKSMQMFHKPVETAYKGDRVGICVTQMDAKSLERGLLAEPKSVPTIDGAIAAVEKIRFFKGEINSKAKFHVTIGHATVMTEVIFFSRSAEGDAAGYAPLDERAKGFAMEGDFGYQESLNVTGQRPKGDDGQELEGSKPQGPQFALLKFENPVTCPLNSLLIGSRFDTDIHCNTCRLAFHGRLAQAVDPADTAAMQKLKLFKIKQREGVIERINDEYTAIGKGLFKKETDISLFNGMKVRTDDGAVGTIDGSFGKSGKYKINFPDGVPENAATAGHNRISMQFKRYMFDKSKKMWQI
ncbi:hypothetical protein CYMTET_44986 [Cymbomonas tetramitiformis]|uniref:Selenocysteine-specific elongation factor n=1 Tax=Cymbomonas tetramitiformis TaxID=36881 RepID=A0AAE0C0C0_9CHLO|nr:hypothetical protein CYMTET_44986 [Cymbomonas tetramitiformis]